MEEGVQQSSNWEVYKDALNPAHIPPPQRRTRAWDRAPVPAHAPRIIGKKIWKKAGIYTEADKDKENRDNQVEFERRRDGPRKKQRLASAVGDIREPAWKTMPEVQVNEDDYENMQTGLVKKAGDLEDIQDASSTLAKRAILTPKKSAKNTPLQKITPNDRTPKKRLSESFRIEAPSHVPDVSSVAAIAGEETASAEKLSRTNRRISNIGTRRKSMRVNSSSTSLATPKPKRRISTGSISAVNEGNEPGNGYVFRGSHPEPSAEIQVPAFFDTVEVLGNDSFEQEEAYPFDLSIISESAEQEALPSRIGTTLDDILEEPTSFELEMETKRLLAASVKTNLPVASDSLEDPEALIPLGADRLQANTEEVMSRDCLPEANMLSAIPEVPTSVTGSHLQESFTPTLVGTSRSTAGAHVQAAEISGPEVAPTSLETTLPSSPEHNSNQTKVVEAIHPILTAFGVQEIDPKTKPGQNMLSPTATPQATDSMFVFQSTASKLVETPAISPLRNNVSPRKKLSQTPKPRPTPPRRGSRRSTRNTRLSSLQPEHTLGQPLEEPTSVCTTIENSMPTSETSRSPDLPKAKSPKDISEQSPIPKTDSAVPALAPLQNDHDDQVALELQILGFSPTKQKESMPFDSFEAESTKSPNVSPTPEVKSSTAETATSHIPVSQNSSGRTKLGLENADPDSASAATPMNNTIEADDDSDELSDVPEDLESFEEIALTVPDPTESIDELSEEFQESSTPDPSTTELVETISENAPTTTFDLDETDMLRSFLTRVKANKAAKAVASPKPKRKRSLPHSPIHGSLDSSENVDSPEEKDEFDVSLPVPSPTKKRKIAADDMETADDRPTRRSARTRLPVKAAPVAAPSFIPIRRLDQDGDSTVTLRRSEEKDLAALTRVNTRKNKGGAMHPLELLKKKAEEKEDPAARQRALKEIFDKKAQKQEQGKRRKTVVWAEVLAQFQTVEGKIAEAEKEIEMPAVEKNVVKLSSEEKKLSKLPVEEKKALKVGMRSKIAIGKAANGTPAPKRKMRGRP